jgi:hypothetical protein
MTKTLDRFPDEKPKHLIDRHILAEQAVGEEDNLINHYGGNCIGA